MGQYAEEWRTLHNFLAKYGGLFETARDTAAKADALDDACVALESRKAGLERDVAAAEERLAGTAARLRAVDDEIAKQREAKMADIVASARQAADALAAQHEQMAHELDGQIRQRQSQLSAVIDQVRSLERDRDDLRAAVASLQQTHDVLEAKKAEIAALVGGGSGGR